MAICSLAKSAPTHNRSPPPKAMNSFEEPPTGSVVSCVQSCHRFQTELFLHYNKYSPFVWNFPRTLLFNAFSRKIFGIKEPNIITSHVFSYILVPCRNIVFLYCNSFLKYFQYSSCLNIFLQKNKLHLVWRLHVMLLSFLRKVLSYYFLVNS
jgi:hypothetical protein